MSIFDIFSSKPAAAPAPTAPAQPAANNPAQPAPNTDPAAAVTPAPAPAATPLDQFTKLWETDPNSGTPADTSLFGAVDPKKVFEAAKGANFASAIPQDVLAAVANGGDGAVAALQQAINASTQAAFAQSTIAATKLIEQAIAKATEQNMAALPGLVKRHAAADSLQTENPALSNPAAQPIISAIQAQLAIKYPDATASQLAQMAKDYLGNFAEVVKPTKPVEAAKPAAGEMDWSNFLAGNP